MTIQQHIPSVAKDRVNEILEEHPEHKRYVMKIMTAFNSELKNLSVLDKSSRSKAILLFTEWRVKNIEEASIPEVLKTHLQNVLQTLGKIEQRKIEPKWGIVNSELELLTKWYLNKSKAEKVLSKMKKVHGTQGEIVSWNQLREKEYKRKIQI